MSKKDPWLLDANQAKKTKEETVFKSKGEICPKRNISIGERCKACEEVSHVYQTTNDGDPKRKAASRLGAKASYFCNVVMPANKEVSVILEMGKKLGDTILDENEKGEWLDIAHPKKGMGRELRITKKKGDGNFPSYSITPILDKADWDIKDNILENLPNLDQLNLIDIIQEDKEEIFKASSLKTDESTVIRICPPWKEAMDRGEMRILTPVFRHWGGVTREQIENGGLEFTVAEDTEPDKEKSEIPWEGKKELDVGQNDEKEEAPAETPKEEKPSSDREPCFGKPNVYEEDDDECKECKDYKACGRAVAKAG